MGSQFALTLTAVNTSAGPVDLAGFYLCLGTKADGSHYEAIVQIAQLNDAYQLRWIVDSEVVAVAMAIRQVDVLAVAYFAGLPGIAAYRIEAEHRLVGEWTLADAGGVLSSETLTKILLDKPEPAQSPSAPDAPSPQDQRQRPQRDPIDPASGVALVRFSERAPVTAARRRLHPAATSRVWRSATEIDRLAKTTRRGVGLPRQFTATNHPIG